MLCDVIINKINESFVEIDTSDDIHHEIYTRYSEYQDGYQFSPQYKAHIWDGKLRVYNLHTHLLPIGLIIDLIKYCTEKQYSYELNDFRDNEFKETLDEELYKSTIDSNMSNNDMTLRDYQDRAVRAALTYHRGILLSCTSSGKSLMLYNIIRTLRTQNYKNIILIVPNIMLVNQMYDDFKDYGYQDLENEVERLGGGNIATFDCPVLISTWESLQNKDEDFFEKFDAVFVDETHTSKAKVLSKIIKSCVNAKYKIGTTGTLPTSKADLLQIRSILGDVIFELKSKELIDKGVLTKIKIANIVLKYPSEFIASNKGRSYQEEVKMVEEYENRNKSLKMILDHTPETHNILILVNHLSHIKDTKKWLNENYPNKKVSIINGSVSANEREEIRVGLEEEDGTILLATFATMSTGVNIPKLHEIVLYSNSKSKIKVLQSIGRGLRRHKTKNQIILYDIVDDLRYQTRTGRIVENYLIKHWKERLEYYKDQEFETLSNSINI